ncbi:MAG: ribose 5-phosphate isomerase B [Deltaproteobacteria bacterium]
MPKILIGSDHAGFELKTFLADALKQRGLSVIDVGCHSKASCDYPEFAKDLCVRLLEGEAPRGMLICGTGLGMSMAANRYRGIRAALCTTEYHARMSRAHNDCNVLVLGGRVTGCDLALSILREWLETSFEGERHQRRIDLIEQLSLNAETEK